MFEFLKRQQSRSNEDAFVALMVVASEDAEIRAQLLGILTQDRFNRYSLLNTWISDLKMQGAPDLFIEALAYLLDDDLANRAREILMADNSQPT